MIIVTGAAGFIGSALIAYLNKVEPELKIIAVDDKNLSENKIKNLCNLRLYDYVTIGDLIEFANQGRFGVINTIIHMGANSSTTNCNFKELLYNNFEYSKDLAALCYTKDIKFVYASSASTYGNVFNANDRLSFDDNTGPNDCIPISGYSFFKNLFDKWIIDKGIVSLCLKYFNVYGPNEYHKEDMLSFIYNTYNKFKNNEEVVVYGNNGHYARDFIYIKDAVKMTYHLINKNKFGIYNIGTGISRTWIDVAKTIRSQVPDYKDKDKGIINLELPKNLIPTYQYYTNANINKLIATGYSSEIPDLKDSVKDYISYISGEKKRHLHHLDNFDYENKK